MKVFLARLYVDGKRPEYTVLSVHSTKDAAISAVEVRMAGIDTEYQWIPNPDLATALVSPEGTIIAIYIPVNAYITDTNNIVPGIVEEIHEEGWEFNPTYGVVQEVEVK